MHENRETSLPTARASGSPAGEGESRTSGMHGSEESDGAVVPMKPSNKAKGKSPEAAEMVEGRAPTKENVQQARAVPAQYGASTSQGLKGVRKAASFAAISSKVGAVCGSSARTDLCGGDQRWSSLPRQPTTARPGFRSSNGNTSRQLPAPSTSDRAPFAQDER